MWQDRVEDGWVVFAPDRRGLPVVVSPAVKAILDRCVDGAGPDELAEWARATALPLSDQQFIAATRFLYERSFLRPESDRARYEARDTNGFEPDSFSIWLHINNHCNLDCAYCFVDKSQTEMSDEVMDRTIGCLAETVRSKGIRKFSLKFAGGEPTLSVPRMERFQDCLQRSLAGVDCSWHTAVLSNGTVMSERLIQFLKRPNTGLSISLDGYGAAGHDIFRVFKESRRGSWDLIEANVEKALRHGIVPYILATISQESAKTLPDLVKWIYSKGLKARLSVVRQPTSTEAYAAFRDNSNRPTLEEEYKKLIATMNVAFDTAFTELEREAYGMDLRNALTICELHFDSPAFSSCCGIGFNHLVINEKGEVASCPMTVHRDTVPMKPEILESVKLTFAQHAPTDREKNEGKNCLDCRWFPVCVSGCPINNLSVNGRAFSVSPLHGFYDFVIPRYIQFFARKLRQTARRKGIEDFVILAA